MLLAPKVSNNGTETFNIRQAKTKKLTSKGYVPQTFVRGLIQHSRLALPTASATYGGADQLNK